MLLSVRLGRLQELQLAASNKPPLMAGQKSEGVAVVQRLLRDLGYDFPRSFRSGNADAIFGPETKRNVETFQKQFALKPDGIVGRLTLAKLDELIIKNNVLEYHSEAELAHRDMKNRTLPMNGRTRVAT